jgi:O-antigen/teichoic acid export membrane protein
MILSGAVLNERLDVLMVTALAGLEPAGLYAAAARLALVLAMAFAGLSGHLAPKLAAAWSTGDRAAAAATLREASPTGTVAIGVLGLVILAFASPLLSLFGPEYREAAAALRILTLAQWAVAAFGLTGALVVLSGHERVALVATGASLAVNAALNLALVPHLGATGAALATLIGLVSGQLALAAWCARRLGLRSEAILGPLAPRGGR